MYEYLVLDHNIAKKLCSDLLPFAGFQKPIASPREKIHQPAETQLESGTEVMAMEPVSDSEGDEEDEEELQEKSDTNLDDTLDGTSTLGTTGNLTFGYS